MVRGHTWLRLGVLAVLAAWAAGGQVRADLLHPDPGLALRSWRVNDGLPQNSVTGMARAGDGSLLLTTFGGLARFDGEEFTLVAGPDDGSPRPGPRLIRLLVDRSGAAWVAEESGGLWRLPRWGAPFERIGILGDRVVLSLLEDQSGALWAGTERDGLWRLDGESARQFGLDEGLPVEPVTGLSQGPTGEIWVTTKNALHRIGKNERTPIETFRDPDSSSEIQSLAVGASGTIWVVRSGGELQRFDGEGFQNVTLPPGMGIKAGELWQAEFPLLLTHAGLVHLRDAGIKVVVPAEQLPDARVAAVLADGAGNLWLGFLGQGLGLARPAAFQMVAPSEKLLEGEVLSISKRRNGHILMALNCRGAVEISLVGVEPLRINGRPLRECVWSVLEDHSGTLWVGTWGGGLLRLKNGRVMKQWGAEVLGSRVVTALYEDREGGIWAGTHTAGAYRFFQDRIEHLGLADGLPHPDVRGFAEGSDGALWIATSGGLARRRDGRMTAWTSENGLRSNLVRTLYVDRQDWAWAGTYGGGLHLVRGDTVTPVGVREGLLDDVVSWVVEDHKQGIWLAGNRGISRIPRREILDLVDGRVARVYPMSFGGSDGLRDPECNGGFQPAGLQGADGRLWFPTMGGAAVVDPTRLAPPHPPVTRVMKVVAGANDIVPDNELVVPAGVRELIIHYSGINPGVTGSLFYRYRMEGLHEEWQEVGGRRAAYFGQLPPGMYRFVVQALHPGAGWGEPAAITLRVAAHWWKSTWFRMTVFVAIGILFFFLGRWRQVRRARHQREQAEIVRRLAAAVLHEFRQPLQVLRSRLDILRIGSSGDAGHEAKSIAVALTSLDRLQELLQRLERLHHFGELPVRSYGSGDVVADLHPRDGSDP